MKTAIFIPPVRRAAGGVAVLHQLAACLDRAGFPVETVRREAGEWSPPEAGAVREVAWDDLRLTSGDVWLVPEGWPNALAPGLRAGARCLVYCQNWAYLLGSLPPGVAWSQLPAFFLAVSDPVARFVASVLGQTPPILRPGLDLEVFHPGDLYSGGPVRVAYMPRKNKALADGVRDILAARRAAGLGPEAEVQWVEIAGLDRDGVAATLRSCRIFLATGFPEGCPLPPLEALASGCLCVGFAGYGGFDYMRQLDPDGYVPWWPLRPVPWSGNGYYAADADILGCALGLEKAVALIRAGGQPLALALEAGQRTAQAYSAEVFADTAASLWRGLAGE